MLFARGLTREVGNDIDEEKNLRDTSVLLDTRDVVLFEHHTQLYTSIQIRSPNYQLFTFAPFRILTFFASEEGVVSYACAFRNS